MICGIKIMGIEEDVFLIVISGASPGSCQIDLLFIRDYIINQYVLKENNMNENRQVALGAIGVMIFFVLNIAVTLLPFYLAYLIISPTSFMGSVAVFFLGLVIVPLGLAVVGLIRAAFTRSY